MRVSSTSIMTSVSVRCACFFVLVSCSIWMSASFTFCCVSITFACSSVKAWAGGKSSGHQGRLSQAAARRPRTTKAGRRVPNARGVQGRRSPGRRCVERGEEPLTTAVKLVPSSAPGPRALPSCLRTAPARRGSAGSASCCACTGRSTGYPGRAVGLPRGRCWRSQRGVVSEAAAGLDTVG